LGALFLRSRGVRADLLTGRVRVAQEKIEVIAKQTYKAGSVEYLPQAEKQIELYTRMGFAGLPICMAKTQARPPGARARAGHAGAVWRAGPELVPPEPGVA
jgi:hypothetical protein